VDRDRQAEFAGEGEVLAVALRRGEARPAQRHTHPQPSVAAVAGEMLVAHAPGVERVRRVRVVAGRTGAAVEEQAADSGFAQAAQVGIGVVGRLQCVGPVADRGNSRVQRLQRSPQRAGMDVSRSVFERDPGQDSRSVAVSGHLRGQPGDRALPDVSVRVDQARDHQPTPRVDDLGVRPGAQADTDLRDDTVLHSHVTTGHIAERVVERHDVATGDQDFFGHRWIAPFQLTRRRGDRAGRIGTVQGHRDARIEAPVSSAQ
jgi:hypothetical protein